MDDLLNKTRYNNLIRPATSSAQLISIQLQLSLAQLISVVGAHSDGSAAPAPGTGGGRGAEPSQRVQGFASSFPRLVDKLRLFIRSYSTCIN